MKTTFFNTFKQLCLLLILILAVGTQQETGAAENTAATEASDPADLMPGQHRAKMAKKFEGTVVEIIDTTRHIYVRIDIGGKNVWVAVPSFDGDVGDEVVVPPGVRVAEFHSRALDRVFEVMYFVGGLQRVGQSPSGQPSEALPKGHPPVGGDADRQTRHPPMDKLSAEPEVRIGEIEKARGGQTVEAIITNRKPLAGKKILLRAHVVKFTPNVMDRNWLHVRDGTGEKGTNDLIVTTDTDTVVETGDVVLIRGVVSVDRDFGYGLQYPVIIEDATVTVE